MTYKVSRGHKNLPPGGILVFLTGQNEIAQVEKSLKQVFASTLHGETSNKAHIAATEIPLETEDLEIGGQGAEFESNFSDGDGETGDLDMDDDRDFDIEESTPSSSKIHVLPLYSQLQTKDQHRVFQPPPEDARLIVLATNVAETSLTIPGIRYVFDCGRAKEKKYDQVTGVQSFEVGWISKASASQRAGRAGRTSPGHCYRLFSSAVYERDFPEHAEPEILRMPVEGVALQLKSMDLQHVVNFPFPTPPDRQSLAKAEKLLGYLGALSSSGKITSIGRELSVYPLSPRFSKILLIGHQHGCMSYTVALVAALAVPEFIIPESQLDLANRERDPEAIYTNADQIADNTRSQRRTEYNSALKSFSRNSTTSDAIKLLTAVCAYAYAPDPLAFCQSMFLNPKALREASHLRQQLSSIVNANRPGLLPQPFTPRLPPPAPKKVQVLQQILAAGFIDQVAIRADAHPSPPEVARAPSRATQVPYLPLFPLQTGRVDSLTDIAVFIHPSSILSQQTPKEAPTYVIYSHLSRAAVSSIGSDKPQRTRMHPLCTVSGKQITALAKGTSLLRYGKPIGKIEEMEGGKRRCWVVPELVGEVGKEGWPLPALKVLQRKDSKEGWIVDSVIS